MELTDLLSAARVDMRALSVSDTKDFGILRMIADDPDRAADALRESGCVFSVSPVLAVEIADEPGSLSRILHILSQNGINLEYLYAFLARKEQRAYMILRVEDNRGTADVLTAHGIKLVGQQELSAL
ncbi:hypothetical protein SDC9_142989 [bioreactor metagenome]|uniref:ACT domain-containing protein n=1 Tax=bioreactor metagenome TaxID=1076179 RepID=A0A645E218_9ZZZZ